MRTRTASARASVTMPSRLGRLLARLSGLAMSRAAVNSAHVTFRKFVTWAFYIGLHRLEKAEAPGHMY